MQHFVENKMAALWWLSEQFSSPAVAVLFGEVTEAGAQACSSEGL